MRALTDRRSCLILVGVCLVGGLVLAGSINALPGFSDHTGPTSLAVTDFERLETGCADDVADYSQGSIGPEGFTDVTFIETGNRSAALSAWTERTSPDGADLSSFRVHVDAHGMEPSNSSCRMGVQYRLTVTPSGGSSAGLLPDAHGTQILWLHNGRVVSCSASVTSPLEDQCHRFQDRQPTRTWANETATE